MVKGKSPGSYKRYTRLKKASIGRKKLKKYKAPKVVKSTRKAHSNIIGQLPRGKKQKGSTLGLHGRL